MVVGVGGVFFIEGPSACALTFSFILILIFLIFEEG